MLLDQQDWGMDDYDISFTILARNEHICLSYFFIPKEIKAVPRYRYQKYLPLEEFL